MTSTTTANPGTGALPQTRTAPPRHNPPNRPAAKAEAENGAIRFLIYLRLHWLTILFCGAILGCAFAYAAWSLMPPKYESYALFQVASSPPSVTGNDPTKGKTEFATYIKTTASLFKSQTVYIAALRDGRLTDLGTIQAEKDPFKYFDEKLLVENKEGTEIIRLSIQGESPEDVKAIIAAISAAYLKEVMGTEANVKSGIRTELQNAKTSLENVMKGKTAGRPEQPVGLPGAAGPIPVPTPMPMEPTLPAAVTTGDPEQLKRAKFSILVQRIAKIETDLPGLDIKISKNQGLLAAAKKALQEILDAPVTPESVEFAKKDPDYLTAQAIAQKIRRDYKLRQDAVVDPNSPNVLALARAAEKAEIEAKKILDEKTKAIEIIRRKPAVQELTQAIGYSGNAITEVTQEKADAQKAMLQAKKEIAETTFPALDVAKGTNKESKISDPSIVDYLTHERLYDHVTAQLIAADYDAKMPQRVREYQPASVPMQKDTKKQIIGTVFAGLMGFVLVGAFVVAHEARARKVSSLGEMKTACATPVVSVIPWIPNAATARDPLKRGDVNEAIDKLRAYFAQTWLNRGATTVTVTSAVGDEGKSFTAFGLSSSLAQAGYKTLLVDFDLREPSLHHLAGVANGLGVCELLRGEADFRKTIQTLPNGLHFLAAGKWSDEARQAAVGGRLDALLLRLKEPFDCIVLHGHALLTAAESVEVARRSEVVLLCAQYRESRVPLLKRAAERIAAMEIPYSGIVYVGASTNEALC